MEYVKTAFEVIGVLAVIIVVLVILAAKAFTSNGSNPFQ